MERRRKKIVEMMEKSIAFGEKNVYNVAVFLSYKGHEMEAIGVSHCGYASRT